MRGGRGQDAGRRSYPDPQYPDNNGPSPVLGNEDTPGQGRAMGSRTKPDPSQRFEIERQGNKVTITRGGRAPNHSTGRGRKGYTGYSASFVPSSTSSVPGSSAVPRNTAARTLGPTTPETADSGLHNPALSSPAPATPVTTAAHVGAMDSSTSNATPVVTFGTMATPIQVETNDGHVRRMRIVCSIPFG